MFYCGNCHRQFKGFPGGEFTFTCANCGFKQKFDASGKVFS